MIWVSKSNLNIINSSSFLDIGYDNKDCPYCLQISYLGSFVKM